MAARLTSRGREMRQVLQQQERSGLSIREFASENGISESRLWYWRRRLRELGEERAAAEFVPVTIVPETGCARPVVVELRGGRRIEVPGDFDSTSLRRLIEVVESC